MPRTGGPAGGNTAARKAAQAAASTVAQQQKKAMQDRAGAASLRQAGAARAEAALREDPARQDAAIAAVAGCGEDVVRGVRENLQASGEIPGGRQAGPYRGRCLAGDEVPGGRLQVWPQVDMCLLPTAALACWPDAMALGQHRSAAAGLAALIATVAPIADFGRDDPT